MTYKLLPLIALLAFIAAPIVIGSAEPNGDAPKAEEGSKEASSKDAAQKDSKKEVATKKTDSDPEAPRAVKKYSSECIASEEVIADLEAREKKLKDQESVLKEKEKELSAQANAIKEEMAKLESKKSEIAGSNQKELAQREEQVNKLIETFEGMSPKAAALVLGGVEEDLAVMALGRLTSTKAGKILSNLKPDKSARLSEMMAYGKTSKRKEGSNRDTHERAAASTEE